MKRAIGLSAAALGLGVTVAASSLPDPNDPAVKWIMVATTIIGTLVAVLGGVFLYRISRYNKDREAAQNTVRIYKDELDAMSRRLDTQAAETKRVGDLNTLLQHEAVELKSRTDITAVLKLQQEMQQQSLAHDTAVSNTLAGAMDRGATQYKEVMDALKQTLDYLAKSARETAEQSKENFKAMTMVGDAVGRIAEHLSRMDVKISDVQESLTPDEPKQKPRR